MGRKKIDEVGNKYGRLTVTRLVTVNAEGAVWLCDCDCGNTTKVLGTDLRKGHVKSCGCLRGRVAPKHGRPKYINETGNKYSRLVVIAKSGICTGRYSWLCLCDCGTEVIVAGIDLRSGRVKSCGCLQRDAVSITGLGNSGKNNPMYTDGKGCGYGTKEQRGFHESIRERDNYTCQDCGKTQEQELRDIGWRLSVHHKNGDHFDNRDENAVTLCVSCHTLIENEITRTKQNVDLLNMLERIERGKFNDEL